MSCIGVLDSGLGGLSVLRSLVKVLPGENFLYAADCAMAPWGDRPKDFILARCDAIADFFVSNQAKAIVLACNTATAVAAEHLRARLSIPVIGIEPAVKPAALRSRCRRIGVIATTRTIESKRYASLIERFAGDCEVLSQGCPGLMECVERGEFDTDRTRELIHHYIDPMLERGIDTLVLACTHYPFLEEAIRRIAGPDVELIEPGYAVAQETLRRLGASACSSDTKKSSVKFHLTGALQRVDVLRQLWPGACACELDLD